MPRALRPARPRDRIQSFGKPREHNRDPAREGVFRRYNGVLRRARERGAARRASKGLDALGPAMLAVADQRMEVSVSVSKVLTLRVRTSEARGLYAFGGTPPAFHLAPWPHRQGRRHYSRRGCGGETTSRTVVWAARLELTGEPATNLGGCFRRERTLMRKAVGTQEH
ncbi:MAG: hypothetical protein E6I91_22150 [Chloroflexi bacterium]|nr:MAG: hypothetical protein E6I91_22150 [Chloroflexota bacterium]